MLVIYELVPMYECKKLCVDQKSLNAWHSSKIIGLVMHVRSWRDVGARFCQAGGDKMRNKARGKVTSELVEFTLLTTTCSAI